MQAIKNILWKRIPYERRQNMDAHLENMFRELNYLKEKKHIMLRKAINLGWTSEVLKTVCVLSVFNHYIIGPLNTSGKRFSSNSIDSIKSISHGSMSLDDKVSASINDACREFYNITNQLYISLNMLHSTSVSDIIYYISKENEDENN